MGRSRARLSRALEVLGTARRSRLLRVLREVGLAGQRAETAGAAREFRLASAWTAGVNDAIAVVGFTVAAVLGLYMLWKILRTPGSL